MMTSSRIIYFLIVTIQSSSAVLISLTDDSMLRMFSCVASTARSSGYASTWILKARAAVTTSVPAFVSSSVPLPSAAAFSNASRAA